MIIKSLDSNSTLDLPSKEICKNNRKINFKNKFTQTFPRFKHETTILSSRLSGTIKGLNERLCGQMGVTKMALTSG